ncbi:MAG TPA: SpoIIE family protein phosphatase [Bacteroidales bacterium]|nr:SpoIIE family protein phosphatase [Bacteroidales bacterium]
MGSHKDYQILIADDSEADLMHAREALTEHNPHYRITTVQDGMELCQKAIDLRPDLILSDLEMPRMNGKEAIRFLKDNFSTRHIPIIVISVDENFQEALDAGAIDFILKPFRKVKLILRVKTALRIIESYRAVEKQKLEVEKRNHQIKRQHESVLRQRNIIAEKNSEIEADLHYAKRIQEAILPDDASIREALTQFFILNLPKNIVSGDFYWIEKNRDQVIIAVADATGHGVSGALMHMMGIIFLNQIIKQKQYDKPSDILEALRDYVMTSLHQKGVIGEAQDGMDIALCMFNPKTRKLSFSGANNPLYIINNQGLKEIKGDRMPVGININYNKPFTNHDLQLNRGDTIYLFSDGYADQFGGDKGKKFRYKYFKELLISNHGISLKKQKEVLEKTFYNWKGKYEQIDDVLVMGMRIT